MHVRWVKTNLPFQYPFTISRGTKTHQPALVVELSAFGVKGYGEAPAINYYNITVDEMEADLAAKKQFVEKFAFTTPDRYWHYLHHLFPKNPFLVCALDIAAWDLYGKLKRKPLHQLFGLENRKDSLTQTDYTIGIDRIEKMVEKMKAHPYPIYKIKLGTPEDIAIVEALRKETDAVFRIDANAAWTASEAIEKIKAFANLGVEFIEQPLAKDDWDGMKLLYAECPLPLIADESCVFEQDVERCAGHFHGINIKLTKCSGLTPALRMITQARKLNMMVMAGSMNESSLGTAAIAHFLPWLDHIDADGPLLLQEDSATGLTYNVADLALPQDAGLGVSILPHVFENA